MKNKKFISNIIVIGVLAVSLFSCEKDGDSVGISTETIFPTIDITAGTQVVIETGGSFTPDAVAKEGENTIEYSVDNTLDNSSPGVYAITYSAANSDGYQNSSEQLVIVYDPSIVPTDVSGNIQDIGRPSRKGVISLVEGTTNIFYCTDMGFAGTFPIYFQMDGDVMTVIPQPFIFGAEEVQGSYDPVNKTFSILILPQGFDYNFEYE